MEYKTIPNTTMYTEEQAIREIELEFSEDTGNGLEITEEQLEITRKVCDVLRANKG